MIKFPNENNAPVKTCYTLGRVLGSGAFSQVVEGTDIKTQKKHAIKVVSKAETNAREMFQELQVMSLLNHVNIVHFRELFDEEDGYYVVLELITGGELFDRIIELRKYSEHDAAHVMFQALQGLKHMHDKNLVHRDIKPENLLLSSKEADATVKIADFGFSKAIKTDQDLFETLGTPPYMAPEIVVLRNEDDDQTGYGKPVDVWALGICLYILLSGVHPYQIADEDKMLDNIEDGVWPGWKGSSWDQISEPAKTLIRGMMEPNPQKRLTLNQCLECPWIAGAAPKEVLAGVQDSIKDYQAKKRLKGAIRGVMATNKLANLIAAAKPKPPGATPAIKVAQPTTGTWTTLVVTVLSGKDLASKDTNGKSDPYVLVWCGAAKPYKTKTKYKTLNPEWTEENSFEFTFAQANGKSLEIEIWDYDLVPPDEFMGRVTLPVDTFKVGEADKNFHTLLKSNEKSKKGTVKGSILLEITKK